jgi:hypothetical protein
MNDRVLGDETDSSTWQCSFDHKEQKLGTISLENVKVRKVLSKIELFIEISVKTRPEVAAMCPKIHDCDRDSSSDT